MLAVFDKSVAKCPEAASKGDSLLRQFVSLNPEAVTVNLGPKGFMAFSSHPHNPLLPRWNGTIAASESSGEYSCVWKQDGWVSAYYALAIITMLWSAATLVEAQAYVISGTIAQWYFSNDDFTPRKKIRTSLRAAPAPVVGWPPIQSFRKNLLAVVQRSGLLILQPRHPMRNQPIRIHLRVCL